MMCRCRYVSWIWTGTSPRPATPPPAGRATPGTASCSPIRTAFIERCTTRGLKTALNLHPAEGVHPHEEQYLATWPAGWGSIRPPATPIPFDCADRRFMQGYFELLHHPLEAQGVDFWWLDWQQGVQASLPGLDPLWWLNHLHFYDLARDGRKRSFHLLPLGRPGQPPLSDRLFRRHRRRLGGARFSACFHGHGRQRRLRLVEPRHRRAHGRHRRRRAVRPLGAVRRLQPDPAAALHQQPLSRAPALGPWAGGRACRDPGDAAAPRLDPLYLQHGLAQHTIGLAAGHPDVLLAPRSRQRPINARSSTGSAAS